MHDDLSASRTGRPDRAEVSTRTAGTAGTELSGAGGVADTARFHLTYYRGLFGRRARRRCPHSDLCVAGSPGDRWRLWCRGCRRRLDGPARLAASRAAAQELRVWPAHAEQ